MATVIRSAQISDKAVTLAVHGRKAEPVGEVASLSKVLLPEAGVSLSVKEQEKEPVPEEMHEKLLASIRDRERQLQEREHAMQQELDDERRRVIEEAHAAGYKQGEADAAKVSQERLDILHKLVLSFREKFSSELTGLEDVVVDIAFEAICKIVGSTLHDREGVLAVVREVTSRVREKERLVLRVSPRDYELLYESRDRLFGNSPGNAHELVADERVALGGCLIETSGGTIDGRLEIQMQQLRETLLSARKMLPE